MKKMMAYRMVEWGRPPQLQEVPVPEPGPGQVLIKVGGAGACHSDLHLMHETPETAAYPAGFTLGHENGGWVAKLGPGVAGLREGDPVVVNAAWGCGMCQNCRRGCENYCEARDKPIRSGGLGSDGGMTQYMLIPAARWLVPLRKLDPRDAAPLTDATATSYHAVKRALPLLVPGSTVVVIGVGGLGQFAVQLLRVLSAATVIAVDTSAQKLLLAREMGADEGLLSNKETAAKIKDMTNGHGVEVVLDFVGASPTLALAAEIARKLGQVTMVGLGGGSYPLAYGKVPLGASFSLIMGSSIDELREVVALAEAGDSDDSDTVLNPTGDFKRSPTRISTVAQSQCPWARAWAAGRASMSWFGPADIAATGSSLLQRQAIRDGATRMCSRSIPGSRVGRALPIRNFSEREGRFGCSRRPLQVRSRWHAGGRAYRSDVNTAVGMPSCGLRGL
jgi:propanol-preferring alcohol dehydrogenase